MSEVTDNEEAARRSQKWFMNLLDWTWERGALGKVAILIVAIVWIAPPIFNAYAMYVLWFQFYPSASTLTEKLAVLSVFVALANAEALWLQYVLIQNMFNAYVNRRRRKTNQTS